MSEHCLYVLGRKSVHSSYIFTCGILFSVIILFCIACGLVCLRNLVSDMKGGT
jgi:hypothetical protein